MRISGEGASLFIYRMEIVQPLWFLKDVCSKTELKIQPNP